MEWGCSWVSQWVFYHFSANFATGCWEILWIFAGFVFLAPSGRGLSAKPTGGEKTEYCLSLRRFAPPPSQREAGVFRAPARVTFFFCLRRVTFVNSDKSNQKRHSRGKGFRFPFPLENPPSFKRPTGRGCDPSPLETSPRGVAIIKSRLCRFAAKVGGGLWPPFL